MKQAIIFLCFILAYAACKTNHKVDPDNGSSTQDSTRNEVLPIDNMEITFDTLILSRMDTISLGLIAQFSTGKLWMVTKQDAALTLMNENESIENIDGVREDVQHFHFSVEKKGIYQVQFTNKRPFGKELGKTKVRNQTIIIE